MLNKTIDIHGMTSNEAKRYIQQIITTVPSNTELTVIHGYHGGNALSNMVRKRLKHNRIKQKILTMNLGETILVIE